MELPKYNTKVIELASATAIENWIYLLRHAQDYSIEELRSLFPSAIYRSVINTVEEIQMKTEYRDLYDSRQKAKLDEAWRLAAAEKKGRQEVRQEGESIGRVKTYQELLGDHITPDEELSRMTSEQLTSTIADLQSRLRKRKA